MCVLIPYAYVYACAVEGQRDLDTVRSYLLYRGYDELECGKIVGLWQVEMVQQLDQKSWLKKNYKITPFYADESKVRPCLHRIQLCLAFIPVANIRAAWWDL